MKPLPTIVPPNCYRYPVLDVVHETTLSWCLDIDLDGKPVWFPKSQCQLGLSDKKMAIDVPIWICNKLDL